MPILVMDVTSMNTDCDRLAILTGWLQKGLIVGSKTPATVAIFPNNSPKPYTTPQGWPATTRFSTASTASKTAPIHSFRPNQRAALPDQTIAAAAMTPRPTNASKKARQVEQPSELHSQIRH